jgi:hypothetical protein
MRRRCPSCTRRLVERGRVNNWECEVMPCHGPKGKALVHLPTGQRLCPKCGQPLVVVASTQDALFWLHGFGWGEQTVRDSCRACGYFHQFETIVPPSKWAS